MRVTQNMMTRNYLSSLNRNLSNLNSSQEKIYSGRKYQHGSENVSDSARALRVRKQLFDDQVYLDNVRDADSFMASGESNLRSINDILVSARDKIQKGQSDTYSTQRVDIGKEIEKLKDQVLQFANAQFAGKNLFGGTNSGSAPFTVGADGRLEYNTIPVDDIRQDANGDYVYDLTNPDGTTSTLPVPMEEELYIDLGLGLQMTGDQVDPRSAFKTSFSGLELFGFGKDPATGMSNNVFNLLKDATDGLSAGTYDRDTMGVLSDHLKLRTEKLMLNVIDIGTRTNFLEKTTERLENDILNLTQIQQKLEVTDDPTESINWKTYNYAWMATLQFGAQVLPVSLMDFIK